MSLLLDSTGSSNIIHDTSQRGDTMKSNNWIKRYAECTIYRETGDGAEHEITVSAWVYAGEPEQRYERFGSPPHPGSDPEVDIICSYLRNGTDVELSLSEEQEAEEELLEIALDDENY